VKGLTPPAYSTTPVQPFVPVRSQAKKEQVVTASRYDSRLAGNCTSNGESYDPKSLTAASRSLPLCSTVIVTDVNNGRSVNVRTNDRGPYVRGRSLDLSSHAAENIALGDKGMAKVKIGDRSKPFGEVFPVAREESSDLAVDLLPTELSCFAEVLAQ
jgi:rare lipoprotein A